MPPQRVSQTDVRDEFPLIPASDSVEKKSIAARVFWEIPFRGELAIEQNTFLEHDDLDAVRFAGIDHLFN